MKLVISYRRSDSAAIAGRIYDRLVARYGAGGIYRDIDDIPAGVDFRAHVRGTLELADTVVAIVGPRWSGAREGGTRIFDEADPVRVEIETVLALGIPLCPVLVDGAVMPSPDALPKTLDPFSYLNAITVDSGIDFDHHAGRLIAALDAILGPKAPPPAPPDVLPRAARLTWYGAFASAVLVPALVAFGGLAPPWPPGFWIVTVLAGIAALALLRLNRRASRASRSRWTTIAVAGVLVVAAMGYLYANSAYVYQVPTTNVRLAKGFACTADAQRLYRERCPALGIDQLREGEYEAERFWTPESIAIVRVGLAGLWLIAFAALAVLGAGLANRASASNAAA